MSNQLTGRRIVVTGGASGMGAGLVRSLPSLGARVVSLDINAGPGTEIAGAAGVPFVQCDVAREASVEAAFGRAADILGGLDVLIHAAGISPSGAAESTDLALWNKVMAINATGTYLTNTAAFAYLRDHGGRIINFCSAAGIAGLPGKAIYSASKGAVAAWTRTAAAEWARYGITVNAIAPAIWTPMYDNTRSEMTPEQLARHDARLAESIPLGGRLGDVDTDLVPVLAFLAGAGSKFMTGQIFPVDGGSLAMR
ncbi:SDR family NAD(P)-dependent oxidoreductase [Nocardia jinanensis]|uniref:Short-chain dehydrogenase n=1 Tax=Nocardia jinanensis TaxID=382504 RepID=A0A917VTC3_9NOCA|nr:SDR family oxidoreductase [Nocardia jinanensis]GGL12594.1 short-chain dehydrogenase [Nocardia jinanensis]